MQIQYVKVRESGLIFPVEDAFKNTYRVPISESDLKQLHKEEASLNAADTCALRFDKTRNGLHYWNYKKAFYKGFDFGYRLAEERVPKPAPLPEGLHLITTDQLKTLVSYASYAAQEKFKEWFPAVFAPVKTTYHVGQQFANKDFPGVSYEIVQFIDNRVGILCNDDSLWVGTEGRQLHRVNNPQAITQEEFEQIIGPNSVRDKSLTLLPESGGQSV